jgi:hypothetical protein
MVSVSYSSGFSAAPILIVWENHEWKNWFKPHHTTSEMVQP